MEPISWFLTAAWIVFFLVCINDAANWSIQPELPQQRQRRGMLIVLLGLPLLLFAMWTVMYPEIQRGLLL